MNFETTAKNIMKEIETNDILSLTHCMTRLRVNLKDVKKVNLNNLNKIDGVIEAQVKGEQLQIIIGTNVTKVYDEIVKNIGVSPENTTAKSEPTSWKEWPGKFVEFISGVFIPLTIALGGSGLIKGLLVMAESFSWLTNTSDTYIVLDMISNSVFYFLPFLLAASVAEKIKVDKYLALTLAGVIMYPTLIEGAAANANPILFFGIPIPQFSYATTVIPIIFSVVALKYIFNFLKKIIPQNMELIITSGLAIVITSLLSLSVLSPLGNYAGVYVSDFFVWLYKIAGPFAGLIFGVAFPILVMTGMAYTLLTIAFQNISTLGYDIIMLPIMIAANINQGIANFVVSIKTKDKNLRSLSFSTGTTAILGITEPAMYSVNLRYKKPFYAALTGNAVAGVFMRIFDVKMFSYAGSGIFAVPAYSSVEFKNNLLNALISIGLGIITTFLVGFVIIKRSDIEDSSDIDAIIENDSEDDFTEPDNKNSLNEESILVTSVGKGVVKNLEEIPDPVFSKKLMGEGLAITIEDGNIFAPIDGEVITIPQTKHAIGLKGSDGLELLIHIGIDTVDLEGENFITHVSEGDCIKKGDLLITFDYNSLKNKINNLDTIIVVTNSSEYSTISTTKQKKVMKNDIILECKN